MATGDIKFVYGSEVAMTVTNLHSKASSATAGWTSASVDNRTNLFKDALVCVHIAAVNTAPANSKAFFIFAYSATNNGTPDYTTTGATSGNVPGTEGALTFPDVTANPQLLPLLFAMPYVGQNIAHVSPVLSVASAFGGILPPYWGIAILNHSGMTLAASGNTVNYTPVYENVA